jgi:hypothetical protein
MKALAQAFRYQRLLDEGRYASISEMAAERIERGFLGMLLRLTLLAPGHSRGHPGWANASRLGSTAAAGADPGGMGAAGRGAFERKKSASW